MMHLLSAICDLQSFTEDCS